VFGRLTINVDWSHGKLEEMLHFLELMRATGFEPSTTTYLLERDETIRKGYRTSQSSIFHMVDKALWKHQFIMEKALALARRARHEGWTSERLADKFVAYAKQQRMRRFTVTTIYVEGKLL
jgi:hypothetical protein